MRSDVQVVQACYSDTDSTKWRLKTDASVRGSGYGLELVTPALLGESGYNDLVTVMTALNSMESCNVTANRSCGLHVHVGVSDWKLGNFKNLLKRYIKFEESIDSVMPLSRRQSNGQYCQAMSHQRYGQLSEELKPLFKAIDKKRTLRDLSNAIGTRYVKLNLESFWKHGTVEFRHHSGTTDVQKITNWLSVCMAMVIAGDNKRSIKVKDSVVVADYRNELNMFLRGLNKVAPELITNELKTFYRRRRRALCL